jgi:hypothetical protein
MEWNGMRNSMMVVCDDDDVWWMVEEKPWRWAIAGEIARSHINISLLVTVIIACFMFECPDLFC